MSDEVLKVTCRTCLITAEVELFDWNHDGFIEGFNYAQCFQEVTQLELSLELPQMLCYDCAFELRIAHSFIKRARKADQKLRSYIDNSLSRRSVEKDVPTVAMDERAQSCPAFHGQLEMEDFVGKIPEHALTHPSNDNSTEMLANLTSVEQSTESISPDSLRDSESREAALVLRKPTPENLNDEVENQQAPGTANESQTVQSADIVQFGDAVAEDSKTADHTTDPLERGLSDSLAVRLGSPENSPKTFARGRKKQKFACKLCVSTFATRYSLRRHQVIHEKPRQRVKTSLQCKFCKESFATKSEVTSHMAMAHGSQKWLCHICSRVFKSKIGLQKHGATHEQRERKYSCDVCGTKCLTPDILRGHMKVHDKNRKATFACDQCDKTFFVRSGLVLHKRLHSGDTANCDICQRAFPRAVDLKIHMRSHSNERPYQCETCKSAFKTVAALNFHALRHKELHIKCDVCDKVYANVTTLQKHRKDHDGVSHKCQICEKAFYTKYKTMRHIKAVHSISEAEDFVIHVKREKKIRPRLQVFISENK